MPDDLRALQRRFFAVVTRQDRCQGSDFGARDAIREQANDPGQPRETPGLSEWLVAGDDADLARRTRVYADAYAFRLFDCLADDFESVAAVAGDGFRAIAGEYVARHPPSHPSLRHLGAGFPRFVAEHPVAQRWPWLGELAALEWARVEAFDARDVPLLTRAGLAAIAPRDLPAQVFAVAPAVRLLTLRHPVHLVWRATADRAEVLPTIEPARTHLLVWRRGHVVCHRVAGAREGDALRCAQRGAPLANLCECLAGEGSLEQAAAEAFGTLERWIADGVLAAGEG